MENNIDYLTIQRKFANMLMTLHNTNKTDAIEDFGLLMLMVGSILGDLDMVAIALDEYPESADPNKPATPKILSILSQLKLIDLEISRQPRPESPTSITEVVISNN